MRRKNDRLEQMEDEEDARDIKRIEQDIREGKTKELTMEEFEKRTGFRLTPGKTASAKRRAKKT